MYVKGGSIIPMQSLVQSTAEQPTDTLVVHVYQGDKANSFVYYEDDGESFAYEDGAYFKRAIQYHPEKKTIAFAGVEGSFQSKFNHIKLVLHGFGNTSRIKVNGKSAKLQDDFVSFLEPITRFDPTGLSNPVEGDTVKSIVLDNDRKAFSLKY